MKKLLALSILAACSLSAQYIQAFTPNSGSGADVTFSTVVSCPVPYCGTGGWPSAQLEISNNPSQQGQGYRPPNSCVVRLDWAMPITNNNVTAAALFDDGGVRAAGPDAWINILAHDGPATIENSQCSLLQQGSSSSVISQDASQIVYQFNVHLRFKPAFAGAKLLRVGLNWYEYTQLGSWTVAGQPAFAVGQPTILPGAFDPQDDFVNPAGQVYALLANVTRGGYDWYVGDHYYIDISGPPNTPITVPRYKNGAYQDTLSGLSTDSTGHWIYTDTVQSNEVGDVWEYWTVGNAAPIAVHIIVH